MHIHILGICGTFMAGVAVLAKTQGARVTGSDAHCYPPMSDMLAAAGIEISEGYEPSHLEPRPDSVVIGNALSRGNPAVEYALEQAIPYLSGPAWLAQHFLQRRWVLAVSGTHGKTTTASMLAWILEAAGKSPGFLIGGVPGNFGESARAGLGAHFVVEADEYDTAFFDKRSKFVHYAPRTLIINNLEYDHADIFPDLDAIKTQFHHLVRTVPGNGRIIVPAEDLNVQETLTRGVWTPVEQVGQGGDSLAIDDPSPDFRRFGVREEGGRLAGQVQWSSLGGHNARNALCAIAAARHAGVSIADSCMALTKFEGVARRMELRGTPNGIRIYDDFAHHPTAISTTLEAARAQLKKGAKLQVALELRSNTMRLGVHDPVLGAALAAADHVWVLAPAESAAVLRNALSPLGKRVEVHFEVDPIVKGIGRNASSGDDVVVMSNGAFEGIHQRLIEHLA